MAFEDGPYLQAACFCETAIEGKDGTISIIRMIDTVTHTQRGPSPPEDMPPFVHNMKMVISLKSGRARGRFTLKVIPEEPSGLKKDPIELSGHLDGEERGQNFVANVAFRFEHEGLYWFHVYLDNELLTAMPFRAKYQRVPITIGRQGSE